MRDLLPSGIDVTWGVLLAAPLFLLFFIYLIFFVYSKKRKKIYNEVEQLPLKEE